MSAKNIIITIIVVVVIVAGGAYFTGYFEPALESAPAADTTAPAGTTAN